MFNGPRPNIATLPEPNNVLLVFKSLPAYKPVLGILPATDEIPIVAIIVAIAAVFVPVAFTCVSSIMPAAAISFPSLVFACVLQ
jgi:hypothetical protein